MILQDKRLFLFALITIFSLFISAATAQTRIGTIQGTVQDPNGAVVAGASVTITQSVTGYNQTAKSDAEGNFRLVNVPFNTYALRVEAAGSQTGTQTIDVESASPLSVNFNLTIGSANATVNVTSDASSALVEQDKTSSDTDISQTLLERQVGASPSRGVAGIGRSTFYTHFRDKDELLIMGFEHLRETLHNIQMRTRATAAESYEKVIGFSLAMFEHNYEYRYEWKALSGSQAGVIVRQSIQEMIGNLIKEEFKAEFQKRKKSDSEIPFELFVHYLASTFMSVTSWWLDSKNPLPPNAVNDIYRALVVPSLKSNFD